MDKNRFGQSYLDGIFPIKKVENYPALDGKRIPRVSFYKESVKILTNALSLLKPFVLTDFFITIEDLIFASRISDCIIITFQQILNNLSTFVACRSLFRYIEISSPGSAEENQNEIKIRRLMCTREAVPLRARRL